MQMFIETVFWFHPLVWWIGKRIFEERERACDEEVLRLEAIMGARKIRGLDRARKILLASAGFGAVAFPLAVGLAQPALPQRFEVAMLRLEDPHNKVDYNRPDAPNQSNTFPLKRYTMFHTTLNSLIVNAYGLRGYQYIVGGPEWLNTQYYDVSAKVAGNARVTREQMQPMLQNLLKERVRLTEHTELRMVAGYAMVIAKGGSKLKANTGAPFGGMNAGFEFKFQNAAPQLIAQLIESEVKQPVVDKTGLTGTYDFDLMFTREDYPTDVPHADHGSIFSAIQEQLGLKLESQKVPTDYLVIDHVDRVPTAN